jgi:hypothetical protein
MKAVNLLGIALAVVVIPLSMKAQSSSAFEMDELKAQMKAPGSCSKNSKLGSKPSNQRWQHNRKC